MENFFSLRNRFLLFFVFLCNVALAQTNVINGQINDEKNLPLPAAIILLKGTTISTSSDVNGYYKLSGVPDGPQILVISFIGYDNIEKPVNGSSKIDFQMEPSIQILNEVAVIGYGTIHKSDATGSLAVVTSKDFNKGAVNSIQDAILGKLPGVVITSNSGAPGNTSTIRIRGGSSLDANNDPLIVIDNVPIDNIGIGGSANILATINPNDIENITVLKDASATAIYGARASNGVIQITTKRGTKELKISYGLTTSLSVLPKHVNNYTGDEFREVVNKVYVDNKPVTSLLGTANTNWQKEIYKNAFGQDHNLGLTGSVKKLPYRLSLGYNNSDGVLKTYNFSRTTLAIGLDPSLFKNSLNIHINLKGLYNTNNFAEQGAIASAVYYDPTQPIYNGNTSYRGYTTWTTDHTPNGQPIALATANPVAMLDLTDNTSVVKRSIGNIQFDYKLPFLKALHANLNLGYDYTNSDGHNNLLDKTQWVFTPIPSGGRLLNYNETAKNQLVDFYLNYNTDLKSIESSINVTGGYSWSHFYREGNGTSSDQAMKSINPPSIFKTEYYLLAFFGRLNYTFRNKYALTFTMRDDASSKFAPINHWHIFSAGAFTWKIIEEDFLKNASVISDLKLRLGYGTTGQQDLPNSNNYPYFAKYTIGDQTSRYQFGNNFYNTLRPDGYDRDIKWESTTTTNIGLDFGFLNNRITGSADVYFRKTKDLLSIVDLPAGTNFSPQLLTNIGNTESKGAELGLNAIIIDKKDFNWRFGYNISYNQTKITHLTLNGDVNYYIGKTQIAGTTSGTIQAHKVGYAPYSFYAYHQVYDANGNPIQDKYVDRDGNNIINSNDLSIYKSPNPKLQMGINSRVTYKKWDFGFSGRVSLGNYNYNNVAASSTYKGLYSPLGYLSNQTKAADDTKFTNGIQTVLSDYYIQNASFFRMDNINLGYSLPALLNNKLKIRFNAAVQNAFVITKYKGLDPEISGGIDNNFFPRARIYQLGLNCTF